MGIREEVRNMKQCAPALMASSIDARNDALRKMADALAARKEEIFAANRADLARAEADGVGASVQKRLCLDEGKLRAVIDGLQGLVLLPDPVGEVQLYRQLDSGLILRRVSCPIGVIGVIFEARPDALVQIASLCIKSGNCAVLKGGRETAETNRALFSVIREAVSDAGLPEGCLLQAEQHSEVDELLSCDGDVDLLIPRGSNAFVRYIMDHTRIPVMGHADGVCHIYVDGEADAEKAIPIILDAKTQYPAACNAVETILVERNIAKTFLPQLADALENAGVRMNGTKEAVGLICAERCREMGEEEFDREYLDYELSIKIVEDVREAIEHINRFGSHHTDAILTENEDAASCFMEQVDSAGVYQNCSTRFADGFRYGFGAEVGISTGKIHARGPVGLEGLMTYKYELRGEGHLIGDYASGKKEFHHKDLM